MPKQLDTVLYHGTSKDNVESILRDGLIPTYLGNSIVCMSPRSEMAKNFGEVVLKIDTSGYTISCFEDCKDWERFVWTDEPIPPSRIRVVDDA